MTVPILEPAGAEGAGGASASSSSSSTTTATTQFLQSVRTNIKTLPAALAVIASLTSLLETHSLTTLAETLDLLSVLSKSLKNEYSNGGADPLLAVPVSAGLEIFQRWLLNAGAASSSLSTNGTAAATPSALSRSNTGSLSQYEPSSTSNVAEDGRAGGGRFDADFEKNRASFLARATAFVEEGVHGKTKIAESARRIIRNGTLVLVPAYDEVVEEVLVHAAQHHDDAGSTFFSVAIVADASSSSKQTQLAQRMRDLDIPTTVIAPTGIAHFLSRPLLSVRSVVLLAGAAALLSNGAILAPLGTQQAAIVAQALLGSERLDVWVVAEQWKSVRWFPAQDLKKYSTGPKSREDDPKSKPEQKQLLDITSPGLITAFVTDRGILTPAALAEESIKAWF